MQRRLLSIGTNLTLLKIRHLVFINAGYAVVTARSGAAAIRAIQSGEADAVIVGHSLTRSMKQLVVDAAKGSQLPVIVLHANLYEEPIAKADANLCGTDGAARIVEDLSALLARKGTRGVTPTNQASIQLKDDNGARHGLHPPRRSRSRTESPA